MKEVVKTTNEAGRGGSTVEGFDMGRSRPTGNQNRCRRSPSFHAWLRMGNGCASKDDCRDSKDSSEGRHGFKSVRDFERNHRVK